jgi:hypothetical protein
MAAGLGFKTFTTGEVLTAGDVNGYLMQGILVFASTAARDAAITSPQEGQFAFTKDTNGLWYYDGATWVASGATGDIEGVTAGIGISGGGTSGTVTVTNSMATAIDAKGDLVVGTGADTFSRLAVGANGTTLVADSAEATGLKWATASSGGMTLISTTTLSGSSVTLSSIPSTYKNLQLVIRDVATATDDNYVLLRLNGDSGANRHAVVSANSGDYTVVFDKTQITINGGIDNAVFDGLTIVDIPDYANTVTQKIAPYRGLYTFYDAGTKIGPNGTIFYNQTTAISSLELNILYGTFSGGTALLYGVA